MASYAVLAAIVIAAIAISLAVGLGEHAKPALGGSYVTSSTGCLPGKFTILQSGSYATLSGPEGTSGSLRVSERGLMHGSLRCRSGAHEAVSLQVRHGVPLADGTATATLTGTVGDTAVRASGTLSQTTTKAAPKPGKPRSGEETFARLLAAIAAAILAARLVGLVLSRLGQPQVMGEVLAGILLGPSLVGAIAPGVEAAIFPPDIVPLLAAAADIGLAYYLFLVGMEFDPGLMRGRVSLAALVSNASVAIPMALGFLAAIPLFPLLAPDAPYLPFAIFSGLALSITAFPVLARILVERRMLRAPVGSLALAAASADDITAWLLLAVATAAAHGHGSVGSVLQVLGLTVLFVGLMATIVRRLLDRVSHAYDEAGHVPLAWMTAIFVGVLLSGFVAQQIGIATIFGAFVFGVVMPRRADLSHEVSERLESFVVTVMLPLFFVVSGLKVNVSAIGDAKLWLVALGVLAIAFLGKWGAAALVARIGGMTGRESLALGALMNTRGLTELVFLNIGLELGVITPTLFTILVLMALVTTLATGPALRLIDPRNLLSEAPASPLGLPTTARRRGILVAALDERNLDALIKIGAALARSTPMRDLLIARLLEPARIAPGTSTDERALARATEALGNRRAELEALGISSRVAAFTSPAAGHDVVHLAEDESIDVVLVDGRRPLVGEGVPRGDVALVLEHAPCDAAVLVARARRVVIDDAHPVVVPFGGAEHDWAALELAAWLAASSGASLRLLGIGDVADAAGRDASMLLAEASLVVQQMAGVVAEPLLVPGTARAFVEATSGAGIVLLGLSSRWRQEGIGAQRALLVRHIEAPVLFVRRGTRAGALSGGAGHTGFAWSHLGTTGLGEQISETEQTP